jgi:hypothetical protein
MKYTKLALACSLAIASMGSQAVTLPNIDLTTLPVSNVLYFSGASAPDNFIETTSSTLFQPGFLTVRGIGDSNFRAVIGFPVAGIPGLPTNQRIAIVKRSAGGSVWGVNPVARAQRIRTLDIRSANCVAPVAPTPSNPNPPWTCPTIGTDPVGSAAGSAPAIVTDIGVSDVEPAIFKNPLNTENGAPQLTSTELAVVSGSNSQPLNQIMMGIVATNAVPASTVISRSQYGAALAGKIDTWNSIENTTDNDPMVVCRRVDGSGTQSSYNWFFSGFPCNAASNGWTGTPPLKAADSFGFGGGAGTRANPFLIDPREGITIVENSSSGNVRDCLSAAYFGVDHIHPGDSGLFYRVRFSNSRGTPVGTFVATGTNPPALVTRGGPAKAIGVLSLDSYINQNRQFEYKPLQADGTAPFTYTFTDTAASPLSTSGWSFRHLDGNGVFDAASQTSSAGATGIAPSKANLVSGKYDFVVELTMQKRSDLSPLKLAIFNELRKRLGSSAATNNPAFATLPDIESYVTNPGTVSQFSRGGNTCAPLIAFPPL